MIAPMPAQIADSLLGIPFKECGRDRRTGLDCLGLVLLYFSLMGFDDIPDPISYETDTVLSSDLSSRFVLVEDRRDGDVVKMGDRHLGIVIGRSALHAEKRRGSIIVPLARDQVYQYYRLRA
jgi:cell wall-associated NlpC family hydrolase